MRHVSSVCPISIILTGIHTVPYGKPAVSLATNFQVRVDVQEISRKSNKKAEEPIKDEIKAYFKKERRPYQDRNFDLKVTSDFPFWKSESWQAAYNLCLLAVLLKFYTGKNPQDNELNSLAYQIAKKKNRKETGLLTATSCFGGLLYYRREFEFLKTLSRFHMKIPQKIEKNLYLIDSGKPQESQAEIESFIGEDYNRKTKETEELLNKLEKVTKRLITSIAMEDLNFFKKNIRDNQTLLTKLKVISNKTEELVEELQKIGGVTVVGYGGRKKGSGLLFGFIEDEEKLQSIAKKHKAAFSKLRFSDSGIKTVAT